MKRRTIKVLIFMLFVSVLIGCSAEQAAIDDSGSQNADQYNLLGGADVPDRKIIYTVDMSLDVDELETASSFIDNLLNDDEWYDEQTLQSNYHQYVLRIKTDRLDDFINQIKDEYAVRSFKKVGTDISLSYQDTENRIAALEAQMTRLLELYEEASLSDMIEINAQISDIEIELQELNGELSEFDSLVDYSVVNLIIYGSTITTRSPFINRIGNAFVSGFNGLITFFDYILIGLAMILPFLIIVSGVTVGVLYIEKKRRLKRTKEKKESHE